MDEAVIPCAGQRSLEDLESAAAGPNMSCQAVFQDVAFTPSGLRRKRTNAPLLWLRNIADLSDLSSAYDQNALLRVKHPYQLAGRYHPANLRAAWPVLANHQAG